MNIDKDKIIEYLKKTNLNPNVIKYVQEKFMGMGQMKSIIQETIDKSIGLGKDKVDENIISQLMKGNENFCITPEGNLWIKNVSSQQDTRKPEFVKISGQMFGIPNFEQDSTIISKTGYTYIEGKDDKVSERRISINEHYNAGEQYYSGKVNETIYDSEIKRLLDKSAQWSKKEGESIPDGELVTSIKTYSNIQGKSFPDGFNSTMQNYNEWNSLMEKPATIVEKNFQKDLMDETNKKRITIDKIKSFLSRFQNKEHEVDRMNRN